MFAIGIDIGGTNTRVGLVKESGALLQVKHIPTDLTLPAELFLKLLLHEAHPFLKDASAIGIGIAGQTDGNHLYFAPNLGWKNIDIGDIVAQMTRRPVIVENDVRAGLIAEAACGAGRECDNLLMLALGTGLGGAAITNGTLLRGSRGAACEVGHLCIDFNGRECTCGGRGCLEAYVGGWAITKAAGGTPPEEVFAEAKKGNEVCQKLVNEVIVALGAGVASLLNLLNPEKVIYTGGIFEGHPELVPSVLAEAQKRALPIAVDHVEWKPGELEHSGVIGSALEAIKLS
jgi:glucokinase